MASSAFVGWFGGGAPWSWDGTTASLTGDFSVSGSCSLAAGSVVINSTSMTAGVPMLVNGANGYIAIRKNGGAAAGLFFGSADDVQLFRGAADRLDLASGDNFRLVQGYIEGTEQTAPSAPSADGYRIFAQDNGGGKTQLMVIFSSGAAQQLAIQP